MITKANGAKRSKFGASVMWTFREGKVRVIKGDLDGLKLTLLVIIATLRLRTER